MEPSTEPGSGLFRQVAVRVLFPELPHGTTPVLRLMPEWTVDFPLWTANGVVGPLEPDDLPISEDLKSRLGQWGREWEQRMDPVLRDEPEPDMSDWMQRGHELRHGLLEEIGDLVEIRDCYS